MKLMRLNKVFKTNIKSVSWYGVNKFYEYLPAIVVKKIKSKYIKNLFIMSKGYNKLRKKNNLDLYFKVIRDFETDYFDIEDNKISPLFIDLKLSNKNEKIQQFIQQYFFSFNWRFLSLSRSLLYYIGKNKRLIYPIAPQTLPCFEKNNISVNNKISKILWYLYVLIFYLYGLFKIFEMIIKISKNIFFKRKNEFDKSAFFTQVPPEQYSFINDPDNKYNFFSFFINSYNKDDQKIYNICHNTHSIKKFRYNNINFFKSDFYHPYLNLISFLDFLFWSLKAISLSFFDIFRGRWWHALMLYQSAERYLIKLIDKKHIHDFYLFNNSSGHANKPLWLYEAEKKDSKVIFYFYSLNYSIIMSDKKRYNPPGMLNANWENYYVWNKLHEKQLKKYCKYKFNVIATFPTTYTTGNKKFVKPAQKFVTVFDVTPIRKTFYKTLFLPSQQYNQDDMIAFLTDILDICKKHDFKLILKNKRLTGASHKKYLYFLEKFIKEKNVLLFDQDISSVSLIQQSQFIISYPMTSPNSLANFFNIKNCYYQPITEYSLDESLAFGSKIIYKKNELEQNICETLNIN